MAPYFKILEIPNLKTIQSEVARSITKNVTSKSGIFNIVGADQFKKIFESDLIFLGLDPSLVDFRWHVVKADKGIIHIDSGPHHYSLNIPIENCAGTYTSFYNCEKEPEIKKGGGIGIVHDYYHDYTNSLCTKIAEFETSKPAIINTQVPHKVHNPKNLLRINILIRSGNNEMMKKLMHS